MDLSRDDFDIRGLSLGAASTLAAGPLARLVAIPLDHGTAFAAVSGVLVLGMAFAGWVSNHAPPEDWLLQAGVSGSVNWVVFAVVSRMVTPLFSGEGPDFAAANLIEALSSSAHIVWPGHVLGVAIARRWNRG